MFCVLQSESVLHGFLRPFFCEMRQAEYELIGHMTHINLLHRHAMADKFFDSLKLAS